MRETSSKVTLSGVPETMLQTVYARARETQTRGAVRDEKAVEIIRRLDYDFSLADKDSAMSNGVIARTIVLDKLVKTYLSAHPGAVAVNIACGLDTRCYRMQGYQHWYNLDLPETIAVREKLLPENGKISQIAMSAMDDWGGMIRESGDALVIIEGLTMYLSEADVQRIFDVIARRFPRVTVLVEVMNPLVVRNFKEKSIEGSHAKFTWHSQRAGTGGAAAGLPAGGRAQPDRRHGGVPADLQGTGQDSSGAQYLKPHRRAAKIKGMQSWSGRLSRWKPSALRRC